MLNKGIGRSLFSRVGAYAVFVLGFWLLYQAFDRPSLGLGVLGGALVLLAMYMMVGFKRYGFGSARDGAAANSAELPADETSSGPPEDDELPRQ